MQIEDDFAGGRNWRGCPFSWYTMRLCLFHSDICCQRKEVSESIVRGPSLLMG